MHESKFFSTEFQPVQSFFSEGISNAIQSPDHVKSTQINSKIQTLPPAPKPLTASTVKIFVNITARRRHSLVFNRIGRGIKIERHLILIHYTYVRIEYFENLPYRIEITMYHNNYFFNVTQAT